MRNAVLIMFAAVAVLTMAGCNKRETQTETQHDVNKAAQQGEENVNAAVADRNNVAREGAADVAAQENKLTEKDADARRAVSKEQVKVEREAAKADYAVSIERCEAQRGSAMDACKSSAKATLDAAEASLDARS